LNLGGVRSTDALTFSRDEKYTISAHSISSGKNTKSVGGLVKWNYETKVCSNIRVGRGLAGTQGEARVCRYPAGVLTSVRGRQVLGAMSGYKPVSCRRPDQ